MKENEYLFITLGCNIQRYETQVIFKAAPYNPSRPSKLDNFLLAPHLDDRIPKIIPPNLEAYIYDDKRIKKLIKFLQDYLDYKEKKCI